MTEWDPSVPHFQLSSAVWWVIQLKTQERTFTIGNLRDVLTGEFCIVSRWWHELINCARREGGSFSLYTTCTDAVYVSDEWSTAVLIQIHVRTVSIRQNPRWKVFYRNIVQLSAWPVVRRQKQMGHDSQVCGGFVSAQPIVSTITFVQKHHRKTTLWRVCVASRCYRNGPCISKWFWCTGTFLWFVRVRSVEAANFKRSGARQIKLASVRCEPSGCVRGRSLFDRLLLRKWNMSEVGFKQIGTVQKMPCDKVPRKQFWSKGIGQSDLVFKLSLSQRLIFKTLLPAHLTFTWTFRGDPCPFTWNLFEGWSRIIRLGHCAETPECSQIAGQHWQMFVRRFSGVCMDPWRVAVEKPIGLVPSRSTMCSFSVVPFWESAIGYSSSSLSFSFCACSLFKRWECDGLFPRRTQREAFAAALCLLAATLATTVCDICSCISGSVEFALRNFRWVRWCSEFCAALAVCHWTLRNYIFRASGFHSTKRYGFPDRVSVHWLYCWRTNPIEQQSWALVSRCRIRNENLRALLGITIFSWFYLYRFLFCFGIWTGFSSPEYLSCSFTYGSHCWCVATVFQFLNFRTCFAFYWVAKPLKAFVYVSQCVTTERNICWTFSACSVCLRCALVERFACFRNSPQTGDAVSKWTFWTWDFFAIGCGCPDFDPSLLEKSSVPSDPILLGPNIYFWCLANVAPTPTNKRVLPPGEYHVISHQVGVVSHVIEAVVKSRSNVERSLDIFDIF